MSLTTGHPLSKLAVALIDQPSVSHTSTLAESLATEMAVAWANGNRVLAEEFLNRVPELWDQPDRAIRILYEEICLREESGEPDAANAVLARFPQWETSLRRLLDCHRLLDAEPNHVAEVQVGEQVGEFRLIAELGRGAIGGVFLAEQSALSDRPVVLKITPLVGHEHLSLARLQHTQIVPLYSAVDDTERGLRILCMPYFGGASVARVLELLDDIPPKERTGRDLLAAIDQVQANSPVAVPGTGPTRQFFERSSYVEAVCWIGACIADAIHYAHDRGLVHFDIKPANILLAADGTPMLLDFHLARPPVESGATEVGHLGGTPFFMPGEHVRAMEALQHGQPIPETLDRRCDIFALGLALAQLLGTPPFATAGNLNISTGLGDILAKSTAASAKDRYPTAAALAEDLRHHLAHRPLHGVRNRSLAERWRKWRHRKPHASLAFAGLLVAAASALVLGSQIRGRYREAEQLLRDTRTQRAEGNLPIARESVVRGLRSLERLPFTLSVREQFQAERDAIRRDETKLRLRELAMRIRFASASARGIAELRLLNDACREVWANRDRLDATDEEVRNSLIDVALIGAQSESREEALRQLADVEAAFGSSCVLEWERHELQKQLGQPVAAPSAHPRTAWELFVVGRVHLRAGRNAEADEHFRRSIHLDPTSFWSHFYRGHSAHRLRQFDEAEQAFSVCVALSPRQAESFLNRGLVRAQRGQTLLAKMDFEAALANGGHNATIHDELAKLTGRE